MLGNAATRATPSYPGQRLDRGPGISSSEGNPDAHHLQRVHRRRWPRHRVRRHRGVVRLSKPGGGSHDLTSAWHATTGICGPRPPPDRHPPGPRQRASRSTDALPGFVGRGVRRRRWCVSSESMVGPKRLPNPATIRTMTRDRTSGSSPRGRRRSSRGASAGRGFRPGRRDEGRSPRNGYQFGCRRRNQMTPGVASEGRFVLRSVVELRGLEPRTF